MNVQRVKVNIIPSGIIPVANLSQGDYGREIMFEIFDGNSPADLSEIQTAFLSGKKPDGKAFSLNGTITNNCVSVTSSYQSTALSGNIEAKLVLIDSDSQLKSALIIWDVDADPSSGSVTSDEDIQDIISAALEIKDEAEQNAYNAGQSALAAAASASEASDSETNAAASESNAEAWAVGERGGVPVEQTDDTYHNNSKYYSEQAAESATICASILPVVQGYAESAEQSTIVCGSIQRMAGQNASDSEAFATGKRNGTDVPSTDPAYHNNASYYAGVASQYAQGGLIYKGSVTFANIPTTDMRSGDMYNIEDDFTTDSRFQEGAGKSVKAGTNIAWNPNNKWDVLAMGGGNDIGLYVDQTTGKVFQQWEEE